MKKALVMILSIVMLIGCFAGCGQSAAPAEAPAATEAPAVTEAETVEPTGFDAMEPVVLKLGHGLPEGEMGLWIVENWMKAVEEGSAGKITFDYYPGGQLGTLAEIVEQLNLGAVDIIFTETSLWQQYVPEVGMISAPFIVENYDHCGRVLYGDAGKLVEKSMLENTNGKIIGWCYNGARVMACTVSFDSTENCKNIIMRSPESQVYIDTFDLMGMSPTPLAFSEVYTAIQTGVVQGYECPAQSIYSSGTYQIAPFIVKTRHMYSYNTLDIYQPTWDKLPECAQNLLVESWQGLQDEMNQMIVNDENDKYDLMAADGATINEFTRSDEFKQNCETYWAEKAASIGGYSEQVYEAIMACR